jgi:hypothetical protein
MNKIVVLKYYTNEILELKIVSRWIIYINKLQTFGTSTST